MLVLGMHGVTSAMMLVMTYPSAAATADTTAALILVQLTVLTDLLTTDRSSTVLLSVNECHSRYRVSVVVVVLVATLDQLLLCFLYTQRSHKALTLARYIYICHVPRVIDTRLPLEVMTTLVMMTALIHRVVTTHTLQRLLSMALIDWVRLAM